MSADDRSEMVARLALVYERITPSSEPSSGDCAAVADAYRAFLSERGLAGYRVIADNEFTPREEGELPLRLWEPLGEVQVIPSPVYGESGWEGVDKVVEFFLALEPVDPVKWVIAAAELVAMVADRVDGKPPFDVVDHEHILGLREALKALHASRQ